MTHDLTVGIMYNLSLRWNQKSWTILRGHLLLRLHEVGADAYTAFCVVLLFEFQHPCTFRSTIPNTTGYSTAVSGGRDEFFESQLQN